MLMFIYLFTLFCGLHAVIYDSITGQPATEAQLNFYRKRNNLDVCTRNVKPCDPEEWRRVDGSCNNLKYPSVGTQRTPTNRILPPILNPNYDPVNKVDGEPFPLARRVRCELLSEGKASDLRTTQLLSYFLLFASADINSLHDIFNYMRDILYCCEPRGETDYMCTPNKIPVDDPVHRYSGIRCMNLTRPESFQTHGCLENGTTFVRMTISTPTFDLSQVYNAMTTSEDLRTYKNGLLKIEEDQGKLFPPSTEGSGDCFLNQPPRETRCNRAHFNTAIGPVFCVILFYRLHNYIANELYKLNPCWDDDRLFYTARDINIAVETQILYYELLPTIFGRENMIRDGIISAYDGFRDMYDENVLPQMSDEFPYVLRWFHTIQDTDAKLYDIDGYFLNTESMINISVRTGWFPNDQNMEHFTQGSFRQYSGAYDYTIDFDMAERVLGPINLSSDSATSDLSKGRYFGLQPYVNYRKYCTGRTYRTFWDLKDAIGIERIHRLMQIYDDVRDVELISGLWAEKLVPGGSVPHTLYCLGAEQLIRSAISDRHWYERSDRPHAFTLEQLIAIRRVTVAGVLCAVGDSVSRIQPYAFESISKRNRLMSCSSPGIGKPDLSAWKDYNCTRKYEYHKV